MTPSDEPDLLSIDDTDPVELEEGDESEIANAPETWDADAHAEEYADDPLVVWTDDDDFNELSV